MTLSLQTLRHKTAAPKWGALLLGTLLISLGGCVDLEQLANIGKTPKTTAIRNPFEDPDFHPITMPTPPPEPVYTTKNSLWRTGAQNFFRDTRARHIGDLLTVRIQISDTANLSNTTKTAKSDSGSSGADALFGLTKKLNDRGSSFDPSAMISYNGESKSDGDGSVKRSEDISLDLAATIVQVLPNGNLVISGHQETVVNYERREISLQGIVRPDDIDSSNMIAHNRIAELRVSYGGKGILSQQQKPQYGAQALDAIAPF